jgi:cell division protein FtsB
MNDQSQAAIDSLKAKAARLEAENTHLKAENKRLSGNSGPGGQMRKCINCPRNLPDGPSYFPGYLEEMAEDSAAELQRYLCVYCR